jgi:hypothetical protein
MPEIDAVTHTSSYSHPLVETLDACGAQEWLATPDDRRSFFRGMTLEQFHRLVGVINGAIQRGEGPGGYMPDDQWTIILDDSHDEENPVNNKVVYLPPAPTDRRRLLDKAFHESGRIPDEDAAIAMQGLVMVAVHPLHGGHTRTTASARQLVAPEGRGYSGTDEDREFYTNLVTNRGAYLAQSLHPMRANLAARFCGYALSNLRLGVDYRGPDITGVEATDIRSVYDLLPEQWPFDTRLWTAQLLSELDFNLVTVLTYLRDQRENWAHFLADGPDGKRISVPKFVEYQQQRYRGEVITDGLIKVNGGIKIQFIFELMRCFVDNRLQVFGGRDVLLHHYRLPEPE